VKVGIASGCGYCQWLVAALAQVVRHVYAAPRNRYRNKLLFTLFPAAPQTKLDAQIAAVAELDKLVMSQVPSTLVYGQGGSFLDGLNNIISYSFSPSLVLPACACLPPSRK
jgi:hypothetical protein